MAAPRQIGRYRLLRRIGAGGMAEVWKARVEGPAGFAKTVAIKRVLPELAVDADFVTMFVEEAKLVAKLVHPNIVSVFDFGELPGPTGDEYFLAMDYVSGQNLASVLRKLAGKGATLETALAAFIALESARALSCAHATVDEQGRPLSIVHRDVSPHNVLVSYRGEVKVTDFGVAKVATGLARTAVGVFKGKLAYASPEQAQLATVDGKSDVFSLGVVLWEALSGKRLFPDAPDLFARVGGFRTPSAEELAPFPEAMRPILRRALDADRATRASAKELEDALADLLGGSGIGSARERLAAKMQELFPNEMRAEYEPESEPEPDEGDDGGTRVSPPSAAPAPVATFADQPEIRTQMVDPNAEPPVRGETRVSAPPPPPRRWRAGAAAALAAGACLLAIGGLWLGSGGFGRTHPPATSTSTATPMAAETPAPAQTASAAASPAPSPTASLPPALAAKLLKLRHLHDEGVISDQEYQDAKNAALKGL